MTDNEFVDKYQNALSDLCGVDCAYMQGDPAVDTIVELIRLAVEQKAEIKEWKRVVETWVETHEKDKTEIERLQKECEITRAYIHNNGLEWGLVSHLEFYKNQRAEAIKEFAEKLHKAIDGFREKREMVMLPYTEAALRYVEKNIDDLVKEMEKDK